MSAPSSPPPQPTEPLTSDHLENDSLAGGSQASNSNPPSTKKVKPLNPHALAHEPVHHHYGGGVGGTYVSPAYMHSAAPVLPHQVGDTNVDVDGSQYPPMSEAEFVYTRQLIPMVQRQALVSVMQSIMDDYPAIAPIVRVRCERAMAMAMAMPPCPPGGLFPFPPGMMVPPMVPPPGSIPSPNNWHNDTTPPGSNKKANRGRHKDDEEVCSVHGISRSTKHLNYNLQSQQWECVPGFHCLVSGSPSATSPAAQPLTVPNTTPTKYGMRTPGSTSVHHTPPTCPDEPSEKDVADLRRLEALLSELKQC